MLLLTELQEFKCLMGLFTSLNLKRGFPVISRFSLLALRNQESTEKKLVGDFFSLSIFHFTMNTQTELHIVDCCSLELLWNEKKNYYYII